MRLTELFVIEEARREPARNIRYAPADIINRYANRDDVFVHFSNTPKLGINPKSRYNTPMGLYSYPVKYVANAISQGDRTLHKRVPFMSEAEYVTIFRETGDISNLCEYHHAKDLMERFELLVEEILEQKGFSEFQIETELQGMKSFGTYRSRVSNIEGGEFWGQMYYIIEQHFNSSTSSWARMFQKMDVDCVVDFCGAGIIHPSEPFQAIHFNPQQTIEVIEMMENKSATGAKTISVDQYIVDDLLDDQNRVKVDYPPYEYIWDLEGYLIGEKNGITGESFIYAFIPQRVEDAIRRIISEYPQYVQKHAAMFEMDEEDFLRKFPSLIVEEIDGGGNTVRRTSGINSKHSMLSDEAQAHIKMMSTLFLTLLKSVIQQLYTSILVDIYDTEMPVSIRLRIKTADNESINILLDKGDLSSVEVESHTTLVEKSNDKFNEIEGYIDFHIPQEVLFKKIEQNSGVQEDIFVTDIRVESVGYSDISLNMFSILETISGRMDEEDAIVERATSFLNLNNI